MYKRRTFLLGTSSDVGLFMNESDGTRKLNGRHSGGTRLQFLSVFCNDYRNPLCLFADVSNPYVFYARVLRMENVFALCVCYPPRNAYRVDDRFAVGRTTCSELVVMQFFLLKKHCALHEIQ